MNTNVIPYEISRHESGYRSKMEKTVKRKREELNIKCRNVLWLLGRGSDLLILNKLMVYKQALKPV